MHEILSELLRRGGMDATKGAQRLKSCRMSRENETWGTKGKIRLELIKKHSFQMSKAMLLKCESYALGVQKICFRLVILQT